MMQTKPSHPAVHRVYQFVVAIRASLPSWAGGVSAALSPADARLVSAILTSPDQHALFNCMPSNDQRHAVAVARTLQAAGYTDPALMQAALLHDAAKSISQPLFHRVAIVLLEAFWPAALARLGTKPAPHQEHLEATIRRISWWRRPFAVHTYHPEIGAAWARQAGCHPLGVRLVLEHQDKPAGEPDTPEKKLLAALQWADNKN
jgi:hypothetical protein